MHAYKPNQIFPSEYQGNGEFWSLADLACLVAKRFGVRYQSLTSYRNLFDKCEFSYQRTTQQYQSCSLDKVMAFEEALEKTNGIAQDASETIVLAGDEASLYLQATLMRTWSATGQTPLVRIAPQRTSTHFYGALNLLTGQETVLRTPIMNAQISALFLQKLLTAYPDRPLLLLWDRAT